MTVNCKHYPPTTGELRPDGVDICVHLCRRAGGKARGEHEHDGDLSTIIHHINAIKASQLTVECTTPAAAKSLGSLATLRAGLGLGFGCVTVEPGVIDDVETIISRVCDC